MDRVGPSERSSSIILVRSAIIIIVRSVIINRKLEIVKKSKEKKPHILNRTTIHLTTKSSLAPPLLPPQRAPPPPQPPSSFDPVPSSSSSVAFSSSFLLLHERVPPPPPLLLRLHLLCHISGFRVVLRLLIGIHDAAFSCSIVLFSVVDIDGCLSRRGVLVFLVGRCGFFKHFVFVPRLSKLFATLFLLIGAFVPALGCSIVLFLRCELLDLCLVRELGEEVPLTG